MNRFQSMVLLLAAAIILLLPLAAVSQTFPRKPILVILPQAPGTIDVTMRLIQPHVFEDLGQPLVIENRPGAAGLIGSAFVARAAPDGYTLLAVANSTLVAAAALSKNVPFDSNKDFTPITMFAEPVNVLAVKSSLPVSTVKELIDYAKRNPGKLFYGSAGVGSVQYLDAELIKLAAGMNVADLIHVPYKGLGAVMQAIYGGEIDVAFITLGTIESVLGSGKLKFLANYGGRAHPSIADVPDIRRTLPNFHKIPSWTGILGPAGLPKPVLMRLHGSIVKALNRPDVRSKLETSNTVLANTPEEFAATIKLGLEETVKLQKALGIQPE